MTNVQKVPQFIVYGDPDTLDGESWTIQVQVLQHQPQAAGPPVEDPIPVNLNLELGLPFAFYALGQPVIGPNMDLNFGQNLDGWDNWPEEVQAQDQAMQEVQGMGPLVDLNAQAHQVPEAVIDLNQPPLDQDLDLVIINPLHPSQDDLQANEQI